jgi:magnesium-transporting ATPase (P-type)
VRGTNIVWATVIAVTLAQFMITYLPPLQSIFQTEAVPFFDGIIIFSIGVALFAIIETEKQIRLSFRQRKEISA